MKKAGFTHKTAKTGAVTLIQRFGSALNLNIHFQMLFLDGVYEVDSEGTTPKFHVIETPTSGDMQSLLHIARPAVSTHRLERLPDGTISYELKTPYRNGTTHVVFEPLDFITRLAALVPKPRFHLTRFHGVFLPNSKHRAVVTNDGKEKKFSSTATESPLEVEARRGKMSWAQLLARVFNLDVTVCRHCQGRVRIIACIEDRQVIHQIFMGTGWMVIKCGRIAPVIANILITIFSRIGK